MPGAVAFGVCHYRHGHDQRQLDPFQLQEPDQGSDDLGWSLGLRHHRPCAGAGFYTLSILLFLFLLCSISWFPVLETYLKDRSNHFEVHLELKSKTDLASFVSTVRALGIQIEDIESNPAYLNSGLSVYSVSFTVNSAELKRYKKHREIIDALRSLDYVYYIEEMN